ncbi:MAG: YceI family protein [Neisseriaceae bacterium]
MRKITAFFMLSIVEAQVLAGPVIPFNITAVETIHSRFTPDLRINYKKYTVDQNIDLRAHTGHLNFTVYPAYAEVYPAVFEKIFKGPQVMDVKTYPTITFVSTKINFTKEDEANSLEGILTVHGKSIPVVYAKDSFDCKFNAQRKRTCVIKFTAPFDRTKVGINYGLNLGLDRQAPIHVGLTFVEK